MDDEVIERTCDFCAKAGIHLMEYGRCRATLYCGRACQKRHWVTHSNDCEIHRCGSPNDINSTWDFKYLFIGLKKTEIRETPEVLREEAKKLYGKKPELLRVALEEIDKEERGKRRYAAILREMDGNYYSDNDNNDGASSRPRKKSKKPTEFKGPEGKFSLGKKSRKKKGGRRKKRTRRRKSRGKSRRRMRGKRKGKTKRKRKR